LEKLVMLNRPYAVAGTDRDYLNPSGAQVLAEIIAKYWRDRGHRVRVEVSRGVNPKTSRFPLYCVRSDLLGGWPRRP
jgi:hypothetical protein